MVDCALRFDGRVAIVTGAGKGLGRAYALALAARGARVLVNNRIHPGEAEHTADATVSAVRAAGGEALPSYASVEDKDAPQSMLAQVLDTWGRVDIVVHNAAIARPGFFTRLPADVFDEVMRINFTAPVALTRAVLPVMRRAGYGRMLFCISAAGLYGHRGQAAYSASKGALLAFMHSVRLEETGYDFRANALAPFAETPMTAGAMPAEVARRFDAAQCAEAAAWLVHERCPAQGEVVIGGGGVYRAARMVEAEGVQFAAGVDAGEFVRRSAEVTDLGGARGQDSADACFLRIVRESGGES